MITVSAAAGSDADVLNYRQALNILSKGSGSFDNDLFDLKKDCRDTPECG